MRAYTLHSTYLTLEVEAVRTPGRQFMQLQLPNPLLSLFLLLGTTTAQVPLQDVISDSTLSINSVPFSTRAFWMRRANAALAELASPCPFSAFATAIVNHAAPGPEELVRLGVNSGWSTGNPLGAVSTYCPTLVACCSLSVQVKSRRSRTA